MTVAELVRRVVEQLRSANDGRDITRLALPIIQATVLELQKNDYLTLEDTK